MTQPPFIEQLGNVQMQHPFTPGPWHHGVGNPKLVWSGAKIESKVVANCTSDDYPVNDLEQEANARLIASAPDMLEVVRDLVLHFEGVRSPLADRAAAVIAKVKGK